MSTPKCRPFRGAAVCGLSPVITILSCLSQFHRRLILVCSPIKTGKLCKHEGYVISMYTLYSLAKKQPSRMSGFSKSTQAPIFSLFRRLLQLFEIQLDCKICCKPFGGIFKKLPDLKKPSLNFLHVCNALICVTASK